MKDASNFYKLDGDKLTRTHRTCPKCGTGYFLADHYDRWSCGRCGYTIFKRKGKKAGPSRSPKRRSPRRRVKSR